MVRNEGATSTYSTPSPGQILSRLRQKSVSERTAIDVSLDPFRPTILAQAFIERGIMLAPLLVIWHYQVVAAKPFARWLGTKDIILSGARFGLQSETADTHYFGTYLLQQSPPAAVNPDSPATRDVAPIAVQTLWGFSSEVAMTHMFDVCSGRLDRTSIVENDLHDFVCGLREHVDQAGKSSFCQTVLVSSVVA